jgi:outer membrane PBP1 activator LpoA protein
MNIKSLFYPFLILVLAMLTACSTPMPSYTPKPYTPTAPATPTETEQMANIQQKAIQALLKQANAAATPQREFYQLQAAYLLAEQRQTTEAQQLLTQMGTANLTAENQYLYELVSIDILRQQGQVTQAAERLQNLAAPASVNSTIQIIALELKANLYADRGDNLASMRERIALDTLLNNATAQKHNREQIWALASSLPPSTLVSAQQNSGSVLDGWLKLAQITQQHSNPAELNAAVQLWQAEYPGHPANSILNVPQVPTEDSQAQKYTAIEGAEQVALLLPLTGKLSTNAASIRDGFFTAYNSAQTKNRQALNIKVYDTDNDQNAAKTYQQAVKDGAELVVGPLTKSGVDQINKLNRLPVPVIALNDAHSTNRHKDQLFEFGLAPEDEARTAAKYAFQQGKRQALIFVQADEWGRRVAAAFADEWTALGGKIASRIAFEPTNKMGQLVRQGLRINLTAEQKDDSNKKPQVRSDVDMIFLASYPNTARQLQPLLNYYYAGHIKVYGTSSIYALPPNVSLDKDLNGVSFCDMPWLIAPRKAEPQLHATIEELWPSTADSYARFYALGIDAYKLTTQIQDLQSHSIYEINGVTGQLELNNNSRIEREVTCTQFQQGRPVLK